MKIKVEKPTAGVAEAMRRCPTWSKEASVFDWQYEEAETCYLLAGDVRVVTEGGEAVEFGDGDLVTFPAGLKCTWEVRSPVHKHYRFG